jgi:hypothetical protein
MVTVSPADLPRAAERRLRLIVMLLVAAWLCVCAFRPHLPVNPISRLATIEALVDHGEWSIDESRFTRMTVDKVQVDGRFYSSKPPLLPFVGAGIYAVVQATTGLRFADEPQQTASMMRLFLGVAPWLLGMFALGALLDRFISSQRARLWTFAAVAMGSVATAYASDVSNHTPAWAALLGAAALAAPLAQGQPLTVGRALAAGLVGGLAGTLDLGALPTVGLFGLAAFAALVHARALAHAIAFALAGLAFPLFQVGLNYQISGSWKPFYLQPEAYTYPGSYWTRPIEFDALAEPKWLYLLHSLFGHHGVFTTTPFLVLGAWWLVAGRETELRARVLRWTALAAVAFTWVYYTLRMGNYGGRAVGMRWFLVTEPALLLAAARAVDVGGLADRRPLLLGVLAGAAAVSALGGAVNAWEEGFVYVFFQSLGLASVEG